MTEVEDVGVDVPESEDKQVSEGSGRLNPLIRRLKPSEAAEVLYSMEVLKGVGIEKDETLSDTMQALKDLAVQQQNILLNQHQLQQATAAPQEEARDFNKTLETAVCNHYKMWIANVRSKAARAVDWVMQSMIEDANQGKVTLTYDIPPGQEDFLHETFPEWMAEERGVEVLRTVVQEELLTKGFRTSKDALEKRTHGESSERYYFRLSYTIPSPSEHIPSPPK